MLKPRRWHESTSPTRFVAVNSRHLYTVNRRAIDSTPFDGREGAADRDSSPKRWAGDAASAIYRRTRLVDAATLNHVNSHYNSRQSSYLRPSSTTYGCVAEEKNTQKNSLECDGVWSGIASSRGGVATNPILTLRFASRISRVHRRLRPTGARSAVVFEVPNVAPAFDNP